MSSLYSSSQSISQAFLPTRGMRFAGAGDARVHDWRPAGSNATQLQSRPAATALATYPGNALPAGTTTAGGAGTNGAISGGMLRPGAIDQTQFKAMLAATQAGVPGAGIAASSPLPAAPSSGLLPLAPNAALAAQGLQTAPTDSFSTLSAPAAAGAGGAIQDLTPAQFAALTGGTAPGFQQMAAQAPPAAGASAPTGPVSAATTPPGAAGRALAPQSGMMDTLTLTDAAIPPDGTEQTAALPPTASTSANGAATAEDGTPIGSTDKNGVLVLNQIPDRETRREYADKGIKWRVVDNPASNKLFFGADGKFGWDDVIDLINPLQHIPLVNIAYRHLTGDQENGSAELLGGIAFGPLGALSAIADLAVRSTTGRDIGENVIAMVTGSDRADAAANVAQAGDKTADATGEQVAEVAPEQAQTRTHDSK